MARSKPYSSAKLRAVRPAPSTAPPSTEISPSALLCIKSQVSLKPMCPQKTLALPKRTFHSKDPPLPTCAGFYEQRSQSLRIADWQVRDMMHSKVGLTQGRCVGVIHTISTSHSCEWSVQDRPDIIAPADLPFSPSLISFWWIVASLLLPRQAYYEIPGLKHWRSFCW